MAAWTTDQPTQTRTGPSLSRILRAQAVALGPSLVLELCAAVGTAALVSGRLTRRGGRPGLFPRAALTFGAAFPWIYLLAIRPWQRRWGATEEEEWMTLPGDEGVAAAGYQHTRAVTVHAPAEEVWRWLVQIGRNRGGFYSYDWLENLAGCEVHSAERIHPEWQDLRAGDTLELLPGWGPKVVAVEPGRALVIEGWGSYVVRPIDARTSRLIARARHPRGWALMAYLLLVEIPHFVMERKMLLGIKERAELATGGPG